MYVFDIVYVSQTYLHHQQQGIENDKHHDEIFEWC